MILSKLRKFGLKVILPVVCGLGVGLLIDNFIACKVIVEGISMNPTYKNGDVLIVERVSPPERGDIITFERGNKNLIKRVIAIPGDTILISKSNVYINGSLIDEDYITDKNFDGGNFENVEYSLSEDEYFVMGDNRNNSLDSRYFGVIDKDSIIGTKLIDLGR